MVGKVQKMATKSRSKARTFKGFAVIERPDGPLVWGTLRPAAAAARQVFESWNPPVSGQLSRGQMVKVRITIENI